MSFHTRERGEEGINVIGSNCYLIILFLILVIGLLLETLRL